MSDKLQKGNFGEEKACNYLLGKGYELVTRNYRYGHGEIDIIAKHGRVLVFIEVKLRFDTAYGFPEESVGKAKARTVITAADNYIYKENWKGAIRFDIVAIAKTPQGWDLQHFVDAFY